MPRNDSRKGCDTMEADSDFRRTNKLVEVLSMGATPCPVVVRRRRVHYADNKCLQAVYGCGSSQANSVLVVEPFVVARAFRPVPQRPIAALPSSPGTSN